MIILAWAPFADVAASLTTFVRIGAAVSVAAGVCMYAARPGDVAGVLLMIGRLLVTIMVLGFIIAAINAVTVGWSTAAN